MNAAGTAYVVNDSASVLTQVVGAGTMSVLAGLSANTGSTDGTGTAARFRFPRGVAVAANGDIYVADRFNHTIRKVTPAGVVTTLAGLPETTGSADGTGSAARFNFPSDIAIDGNGDLFVTDSSNHTIRKVTQAGVVTTLAGTVGVPGWLDGSGTATRFNFPSGIAANANGLFVADISNQVIRKVTYAGVVSTIAGSAGLTGFTDASGSSARFNNPAGVAVDASDNVFVADSGNNMIRKVTAAGVVSTIGGRPNGERGSASGTGTNALFFTPYDIALGPNGTLYVVDSGSHTLRIGVPTGTNVVRDGTFTGASLPSTWSTFALPDANGMVSQVTGNVFEYYRVGTQALLYQNTLTPLPKDAALTATFLVGNSSTTRKRISVLVHDSDFTDLAVCTFWLPPSPPLQSYSVVTHTTKQWGNATVAFYAATVGQNGGFYQIDSVSLAFQPGGSTTQTTCPDPLAPSVPGGGAGPNLITNGDFGTGTLSPWSAFGQVSQAITSGVLNFGKLSGTPSGVVLQSTSQTATTGEILTATFQLGNTSNVRKRVTVIAHDASFADLSACTFWLAPNQPLGNYSYRTYATANIANLTLSFYPATVGTDQAIQLDNVTLQRTPGSAGNGVACIEPSPSSDAAADAAQRAPVARRVERPAAAPAADASDEPVADGDEGTRTDGASLASDGEWEGDGFVRIDTALPSRWVADATSARPRTLTRLEALVIAEAPTTPALTVRSRLRAAGGSAARVEVSTDGRAWESAQRVGASDDWVTVDVDLSAYAGQAVFVRFVLDGAGPADDAAPDVWEIEF